MVAYNKDKMVREAVAIFNSADAMQEAIDELLSSGFDHAELSLLASETAIEEKLGHVYARASELEDDPKTPTVAYSSTEAIGDAEGALIGTPMYLAAVTAAGVMTAAGGPLAAIIGVTAAAAGAGAVIGSVLASMVGEHHAQYLQQQLDHGGLLLWVRTRDEAHELQAIKILSQHSGEDVHIHGERDTYN